MLEIVLTSQNKSLKYDPAKIEVYAILNFHCNDLRISFPQTDDEKNKTMLFFCASCSMPSFQQDTIHNRYRSLRYCTNHKTQDYVDQHATSRIVDVSIAIAIKQNKFSLFPFSYLFLLEQLVSDCINFGCPCYMSTNLIGKTELSWAHNRN